MFAVTAQGLLRVWEAQQRAHPVQRAVQLLSEVAPPLGLDGWLHAPIGVRDGALMHLCETLFGGELHTATTCPHCGERLESRFDVRDLCDAAAAAADDDGRQVEATFELAHDRWAIACHLPTSDDLLQVAAQRRDDDTAARLLMQRCILRARHGGEDVAAAVLPDDVVERLAGEMARRDPAADLRIELACPACGGASSTHFDVVSYLWSELDDWAQRTLSDIHTLACAYGWSEDEILALTPARRQLYVDMVQA